MLAAECGMVERRMVAGHKARLNQRSFADNVAEQVQCHPTLPCNAGVVRRFAADSVR